MTSFLLRCVIFAALLVSVLQLVELAVPFTVSGRNWPAGPVFTLKLTKEF